MHDTQESNRDMHALIIGERDDRPLWALRPGQLFVHDGFFGVVVGQEEPDTRVMLVRTPHAGWTDGMPLHAPPTTIDGRELVTLVRYVNPARPVTNGETVVNQDSEPGKTLRRALALLDEIHKAAVALGAQAIPGDHPRLAWIAWKLVEARDLRMWPLPSRMGLAALLNNLDAPQPVSVATLGILRAHAMIAFRFVSPGPDDIVHVPYPGYPQITIP